MHDLKRRLKALEASRGPNTEDRPLVINFVAYDPQHVDHGKLAFRWVRNPGEANYRQEAVECK